MGQTADELSRAESQRDLPNDGDAAPDDPDEIRDEIEQTRSEMSGTIDAIQDRLSPDTLKEQAKEAVRDATIGRAQTMVDDVTDSARQTGNSIWTTVRENPLPAAMVALGVGLLWKNRSQGSGQSPRDDREMYRSAYPSRYAGWGNAPAGRYDRDGQRYGNGDARYRSEDESSSGMQERVGEMAGTVQEKAGQAVDQVTQKGGQAVDQVSQFGSQAYESMSSLPGEGIQAMRTRYDQMIMESPLALGLIAFGVGAAVGLVVPSTERENELMGEKRDELVERAGDMAQQLTDKAQEVASQVGDTVQQSMQESSSSS